MKKVLCTQLDHIQNALNKNISAIKALIDTSDAMGELIKKLKDSSDKSVASEVKDNRDRIDKSINELIKYTRELFQSYTKIIDDL